MAQTRAYLMSFLGLQLATGRDRFALRFPHPWLVWEPGAWKASQGGSHQTQVPSRPAMPGKGDALCFELALQPGGRLHAGRMEAHALVINDATFSRDQLLLARPNEDRWTVASLPNSTPSTLNTEPLTAVPRELTSGATLRAGDVTLRFYQLFDFVTRIDTEIKSGRL